MKNYIFLIFVLAFTLTVTAQKLPTTKKTKTETVEKSVKVAKDIDEKVKKALLKDKDLQKETFNFLKSNPKTTSAFAGLASNSMGSSSDLIKSVLGNKDLASAAINFIVNNPKLMEKAIKIVGM